tara:strand:- start:1633 stop:1980 length:348 start_codon:yes stop_codon:yes gene_type:complete
MANKNKTECNCTGIWNSGTELCDPALATTDPNYIDPCPATFWQKASGWDWNAIGENALVWGYALGFLKPPSANLDNQLYMMELERQRKQMMYVMIALGVLMLVIVIMVLRKNKTK